MPLHACSLSFARNGLIAALALGMSAGVARHATAGTPACFGKTESVHVLEDVELTLEQGKPLAIGRKTTRYCLLFSFWMTDDGYVLTPRAAHNSWVHLPNAEAVKHLQAQGKLPSPLPAWKMSFLNLVQGYNGLGYVPLMAVLFYRRRRSK